MSMIVSEQMLKQMADRKAFLRTLLDKRRSIEDAHLVEFLIEITEELSQIAQALNLSPVVDEEQRLQPPAQN